MRWKQILALSSILLLAGCYQQSTDSFETVNSSGVIEITATQLGIQPGSNATPVVIVPDGGDTPAPGELEVLQVTTSPLLMNDTERTPLAPIELGAPATATIVIIIPGEDTATPPASNGLLPTATPPTFITPQVASQLTIPTATTTGQTLSANPPTNGIQTPTQLPAPTNEACVYTITAGDTLFRIALRNDVTLAALLASNNLAENSIIQPGQVIQIPDCDTTPTPPAANVDTPANSNSLPATLESGGTVPGAVASQAVHRVAAGETLYNIALRYGVTVRSIIDANNLSNPDRLSIGQELIIPE